MISRKLLSLHSQRNFSRVTAYRLYSSDDKPGFFSKMKSKLGFSKDEQVEKYDEAEDLTDITKSNTELERFEALELDTQAEKDALVTKRRLKSRLYHSDRALLLNQRPQAGIAWEKNDEHRNPEFKSMMFARYGKSTGINPNVAWPTKEEIELQKEYEQVLYDGKSVSEMIKEENEKERLEYEAIIAKEKEINEKLAKQEQEIKAWQKRVESRNVFAERERQKRQQILAEVSHFIDLLHFKFSINAVVKCAIKTLNIEGDLEFVTCPDRGGPVGGGGVSITPSYSQHLS